MKKRVFVAVVAVLVLAVGAPAFASHCPTLINTTAELFLAVYSSTGIRARERS